MKKLLGFIIRLTFEYAIHLPNSIPKEQKLDLLQYLYKLQYCMVFFKKETAVNKPAFSAFEPSMKFMKFNLFGTKFNNPFVFKTIFKYEVRFNILNPERACG